MTDADNVDPPKRAIALGAQRTSRFDVQVCLMHHADEPLKEAQR